MAFRIRGYFTIFGKPDRAGEVVDKGALSDWLKANPSTQLPIYWEHDHSAGMFAGKRAKPIGVTTTIRQTRQGGYFEGELADTVKAQEVGQLIAMGAIRQASFGYKIEDRYEKKKVWHLAQVSPVEITVAGIGAAQPLAYVQAMEDQNDGNAE